MILDGEDEVLSIKPTNLTEVLSAASAPSIAANAESRPSDEDVFMFVCAHARVFNILVACIHACMCMQTQALASVYAYAVANGVDVKRHPLDDKDADRSRPGVNDRLALMMATMCAARELENAKRGVHEDEVLQCRHVCMCTCVHA